MKRRTVLSLPGVTLVSGLAGCSERSSTPTAAPPAPPAPIESYGCPPAAPDRTGVVCSHTVDTDDAAVALLPSERITSSPKSLDLTLHNDSEADLTFNPYSWAVRRELTTGWGRLERTAQGDGRLVVGAGETRAWTFAEILESVDPKATPEPGTYTAEISIPDPGSSDWLACVALFRLE